MSEVYHSTRFVTGTIAPNAAKLNLTKAMNLPPKAHRNEAELNNTSGNWGNRDANHVYCYGTRPLDSY